MSETKPYFRYKGRYKDGRKRVVVEWREGKEIKSCAVPKPEKLLELIGLSKKDIPSYVK